MPLIDSPRLTNADRAAWARTEHYLDSLAGDPRLGRLADQARQAIGEFVAAGPCHAGVSWGKDSTALAHLVATATVPGQLPLVWARADRGENPDSPKVRDAFLTTHLHVRYEERVFTWRVPIRPEPGWDDPANHQDALAETMPGRYISGVAGRESATRRLAVAAHGLVSANSCRPLGRWRHTDVLAYLWRHDLPIHPAYAMTYGGRLDPTRIRVHALGTAAGGQKADIQWEDHYYGDVLASREVR